MTLRAVPYYTTRTLFTLCKIGRDAYTLNALNKVFHSSIEPVSHLRSYGPLVPEYDRGQLPNDISD